MGKCKNCGHDLVGGCSFHPHKEIVVFGKLAGCGFKTAENVYCGCTKPEPKEATK